MSPTLSWLYKPGCDSIHRRILSADLFMMSLCQTRDCIGVHTLSASRHVGRIMIVRDPALRSVSVINGEN